MVGVFPVCAVEFILNNVTSVDYQVDFVLLCVVYYPTAEAIIICWMAFGKILCVGNPDYRKVGS